MTLSVSLPLVACSRGTGTTASQAEVSYGGTQVTCGNGPFGADVFTAPEADDREPRPVAAVLKDIRSAKKSRLMFGSGNFRIAYADDSKALLVSGDPPKVWDATFTKENGEWELYNGPSECTVRPYKEGSLNGEWFLDLEEPAPAPDATLVHVWANDIQCASGVSPEDRLLPPEVEYHQDAVVITFWVKPLHGSQTCPGHPPVKRVVKLDSPLGSRRLLDGGIYPPQEITAETAEGWSPPSDQSLRYR